MIWQLLLRVIDPLVPRSIREHQQVEELVRARSLVLITLTSCLGAAGVLAASLVSTILPEDMRLISTLALLALLLGNALALWVFRYSARFTLAANIYVLSVYLATVGTFLMADAPEYVHLLMMMFCIPVVMSYIADHTSAISWLVVITVSPCLAVLAGNPLVGAMFLACWWLGCFTMFSALCMEQFYRESMRSRLHMERDRFEFAAAHDPLTGLANRNTFDQRLQQSIERCATTGERLVLVMIDLNRFKPINDCYGHQTGDLILTTVAQRLRNLVRRADTVARLGGDEFAILVHSRDADGIAARISRTIGAPVAADGQRLSVGCSTGVAVCPDDSLEAGELLRIADERMYVDKRRRRMEVVV
ncbi:GGDEF domain-containing protein [Mangrovimicrobium sediminis]|uniref:GGDEF domain-containing protein n=1 Tax=Mangrovimicrobium sediminis TaxID=2562682 RepID=UPI001436B6A9|nr:GGDEF domain-containing protein [Haliea sp. SAOS-164]